MCGCVWYLQSLCPQLRHCCCCCCYQRRCWWMLQHRLRLLRRRQLRIASLDLHQIHDISPHPTTNAPDTPHRVSPVRALCSIRQSSACAAPDLHAHPAPRHQRVNFAGSVASISVESHRRRSSCARQQWQLQQLHHHHLQLKLFRLWWLLLFLPLLHRAASCCVGGFIRRRKLLLRLRR